MSINDRTQAWFNVLIAVMLASGATAQVSPSPKGPGVTQATLDCSSNDPSCGIDEEISRLKKEIDIVQARLLAVPQDVSARYSDFLKIPGTGVARLLPRGKYDFLPRDRGAYYSFSQRSPDYGSASEIELDAQQGFVTGFAGADYGFFLMLGKIPIESVPVDAGTSPASTSISSTDWTQMWTYRPPKTMTAFREEFRSHPRNIQVAEGMTYILRSVHLRLSDVLVAFHVERVLADRSVVIVWRILQAYQPPNPSNQ